MATLWEKYTKLIGIQVSGLQAGRAGGEDDAIEMHIIPPQGKHLFWQKTL